MHKTFHASNHAIRTSESAKRRHRVIAIAIFCALVLVVASCGSDRDALDVVRDLHSADSDSATAQDSRAKTSETTPAWCEAGVALDAIHVQFHEGGDALPVASEIQRALDASKEMEALLADSDLATETVVLRQAMETMVAEESADIFGTEPARGAAGAVFDRIERDCPA